MMRTFPNGTQDIVYILRLAQNIHHFGSRHPFDSLLKEEHLYIPIEERYLSD